MTQEQLGSTEPPYSICKMTPNDDENEGSRRNPSAVTGLKVSKKRLLLAFGIAAASDLFSFFVAPVPPIVWTVDVCTAVLLFAVLGWQWFLLPGLILEAIPGVGVVPVWVLVVGAIAVWGTARPREMRRMSDSTTAADGVKSNH